MYKQCMFLLLKYEKLRYILVYMWILFYNTEYFTVRIQESNPRWVGIQLILTGSNVVVLWQQDINGKEAWEETEGKSGKVQRGR